MIEVEIKAYAPNLTRVERRLRELGASFLEEHLEEDVYLASPVKDFASSDEALRVRTTLAKNSLTYKGPKIDEITKTREELEVEVSDAEKTISLLERLGFKPAAIIKKLRKVYELEEFWIMLDDVFDVGTFVEVEAKKGDMELRQKAFKLMKDLDLDKTERRSYLELFLQSKDRL